MLPADFAAMDCSKIIETEIERFRNIVRKSMQINAYSEARDIADGAFEDHAGRNMNLAGLFHGVARQPPALLHEEPAAAVICRFVDCHWTCIVAAPPAMGTFPATKRITARSSGL